MRPSRRGGTPRLSFVVRHQLCMFDMPSEYIFIGGGVLAIVVVFALRSLRRHSDHAHCVYCGSPSVYGYSLHPETLPERSQPLCRACLVGQLEKDYREFSGNAVVIQPADRPPVYVFQTLAEWKLAFPTSRIADDVDNLLCSLCDQCALCRSRAKFLWVHSTGMNADNFEDTLDSGISDTLLKQNPNTEALCAGCCVQRIERELVDKDISYLEVCSPRGSCNGFVIPMGY